MSEVVVRQLKLSRILKNLVILLVILLSIAVLVLRYWQSEKSPQGATDLAFTHVDLPFTHFSDGESSLPFLGSAAFDFDGDGIDELFLGGGKNQDDQLFKFEKDGFILLDVNLGKADNDATHGAASIDVDNDGDVDLLTARESGVWLHENLGNSFKSSDLRLKFEDNTTPLSIGLGDINKDGLVDMYVAGYLKIDLVEGETIFADGYGGYSHLFLNQGNGSWKDISKTAGVWRQHNTFIGLFADLDNDMDSDLIIAQDTGRIEMYENNGDLTFSKIKNPSVYSYPMGVAVGDYNNDKMIDLYFSNVGYTLPEYPLRGDLDSNAEFNPAYVLFKNQGGLEFSDVSEKMNAARYGFGWGTVMADMNLDGREDLLAAQNYARLPANFLMTKYPGKILQNYGDTFKPVELTAGAENYHFGISPIISDFNADGWPDLVWANFAGKSLAYLNNGGLRSFLKVRLPNRASSLGAQITLKTSDGQIQYKQLIASQGLASDQGRDLIFGIAQGERAETLTVTFQNGNTEVVTNPQNGSIVSIVLD